MKRTLVLTALIVVVATGVVWFALKSTPTAYRDITFKISGKDTRIGEDVLYFGNEVYKDLDGDGTDDVAFLIRKENTFFLVGALKRGESFVGTHAVYIDENIAPQTTESGPGRLVLVNYAKDKVGQSLWLLLDPGDLQFGEVVQNFEGESDI